MSLMKTLDVVVPCYDEEQCLDALYTALKEVEAPLAERGVRLELILVDNGSSDSTLAKIKGFASTDPAVLYLSLSRNFTKEGAVYAGLEHATGDYIAVMDADLQDPPELLVQMVDRILVGDCDRVGSYVQDRAGQSLFYRAGAHLFYWSLNKMAGLDIVQGARDFSVMTARYVHSALACKERCRFSKGIFSYIGYKTEWIPFESHEREAGEAKWSLADRTSYAIDSITTYSTVPLRFIAVLGTVLAFISLVFLLFIVIRELIWPDSASAGWPSLVSLVVFLGGTVLMAIGVLGQYLAKIYEEVKARPAYIVTENGTRALDRPPEG